MLLEFCYYYVKNEGQSFVCNVPNYISLFLGKHCWNKPKKGVLVGLILPLPAFDQDQSQSEFLH